MRHLRAVLLLFVALVSQPLLAQKPPRDIPPKALNPSQYERKVNGAVRSAVARMKSEGITRANAAARGVHQRFSTSLLKVDDSGRVHLYLHVRGVDATTMAALAQAGVVVETTNAQLGIVQGWAPYDAIETLAASDLVTRIRPPEYTVPQAGAYTTQGDSILKANLVRSQLSITGSGIKVGVISDGANNVAASQSTGDLPAVTTFGTCDPNVTGSSCNEGTAMAEIVHDLAPNATLAIGMAPTSLDFLNRISDLSAWGAKVIVDDLLVFNQPFFEDGTIAAAYANALANGIVMVTSAGNFADRHYQGAYTDTDADLWHEFGPGIEVLPFTVPAGYTGIAWLQWSNRFGQAADDYDLYIWDNPVTNIVASSTDTQSGFEDPFEAAAVTCPGPSTCTYNLAVARYAGNAQTLEIFFNYFATPTAGALVNSADSLFGHGAVPGVIATAAISASNSGNLTAESYSSHGPSTIFFPSFTVRNTPALTTIDCVSVSGVGGFGSPFCGTSAAAPHAAAVAALLLQAKPSLTPAQVKSAMQNTAADRGASGYDFTYGSGLVDALAAVNSVLPVPVVTTGSAGTITQSGATVSATVNPNGSATTLYFDYGTTASYGTSITYGSVGSGTSNVLVLQSFSGLNCGTTYHYRARAQNGSGTTNGADATFITSACVPLPSVTTGGASSITQTGATIAATVNANGSNTTVYFDYGLTNAYGSSVTFGSIGSGSSNVGTAVGLTGLTCSTTYHYRARAQNSGGTTNGGDATFLTGACSVVPKVRNDFNADNKSDLLWRNTSTGDVWLWQMNGNAINGGGLVANLPASFAAVSTGDFNNDGKADIVWRNNANGDIWLWQMNGTTINGGGYVANLPASLILGGSGDFNADGKADLLWRNTVTGDIFIWLMNGNLINGGGYVANLPSSFSVAAVADFNADGKADILWRNNANGDIWLWLMNGNAINGGGYVANLPASFVTAGTGDFNNDNKADIVWRNNANGDIWIWQMNGNAINGGGYVANLSASFVTAAIGDFNADHLSDLVWRNNANGDVWLWQMNGNAINGGGYVANLPSSLTSISPP